jgi:HEPN domain-containing protein
MKEVKELIDYWVETAAHDKDTMDTLYDNARYSDALFFGHIIPEKVLKALVVRKTGEHAPYIHNLLQLHALSGIELGESEINLLAEVNDFNIRARYPEQKLEFYEKCTKEFADPYIKKITLLYEKLWEKAKS